MILKYSDNLLTFFAILKYFKPALMHLVEENISQVERLKKNHVLHTVECVFENLFIQ